MNTVDKLQRTEHDPTPPPKSWPTRCSRILAILTVGLAPWHVLISILLQRGRECELGHFVGRNKPCILRKQRRVSCARSPCEPFWLTASPILATVERDECIFTWYFGGPTFMADVTICRAPGRVYFPRGVNRDSHTPAVLVKHRRTNRILLFNALSGYLAHVST
ncbi:hypothetical protein BC835DRAFT_664691 [Cytidiella melzeri]|nr:hypothetical protein BC835DRAFT_664691 [Cytidiella melzeri]